MSLVAYSEFQEHRERRRRKVSIFGDRTPYDDATKHHVDGQGKKHMDEAAYDEGAEGSEEPQHDARKSITSLSLIIRD